jgi:hypothetical protein
MKPKIGEWGAICGWIELKHHFPLQVKYVGVQSHTECIPWNVRAQQLLTLVLDTLYTICPADNATAGCLGRRRAGQLRFGFVAVLEGHIVYMS